MISESVEHLDRSGNTSNSLISCKCGGDFFSNSPKATCKLWLRIIYSQVQNTEKGTDDHACTWIYMGRCTKC
jgi:hypothetical protein